MHSGFKANRIPWRGDSGLNDGSDVGLNLTGGWHDAGDHVKFGLPMAFSAGYLAWGVLEFEDALRSTGQLEWAKDNLRWVADYLIRAHVAPKVLYGQVGKGHDDHAIWGSPEVMPMARPAYKIDEQSPGPDLAAQTAAAMVSMSMVFRADEPLYADVLLQRGKELYDFAQATRDDSDPDLGHYSDSILDAQSFYKSRSGAKDDLPYAAAWLYLATGEAKYLHDAEADYTRIADRSGHKGWTMVWDDVRYGVYVLMSKIYSLPEYPADSKITTADRQDGYFDYNLHAQNFFNHWTRDGGVTRTPGGMAWLAPWGSARYNTSTALLALIYRKHLEQQNIAPQLQQNYLKFATEQVNYVLGDNPLNMSYMVGFGDSYSQYAHHRASHGSTTNSINNPSLPRHILYGGLAGGPTKTDAYTTDRSAYTLTEVATDMNAGITGALAGLVDAYGAAGNTPDANFPAAVDINEDGIYVKAILQTKQPSDLGTEVQVKVVNEAAYPPRDSDGLKFRYFIDLSELFALGYTENDLILETYWDEGAGVSLHRWQDSAYIFYVEGSFVGTNVTPLGNEKKQKNMLFIIRLPWIDRGWNPNNDSSYQDLVANTSVKTDKIALYDENLPANQQLIWGVEPEVGLRQSEVNIMVNTPVVIDNNSALNDQVSEPAQTTFDVAINVYNDWGSGHCAEFEITNTGEVTGRPSAFSFYLPESLTVTNLWNGEIIRSGDSADVTLSAYMDEIAPGETGTQFGYCASGSGTGSMEEIVVEEPEPVVTEAEPESAVVSFEGRLNVYNQWNGGYCVRLHIANTGEAAGKPQGFRFGLSDGVPITTNWGGALQRNNGLVDVAIPSWLEAVQLGEEVASGVGFCAGSNEQPSQLTTY